MGETSAVARYVSEFVGTFVLVFTTGCIVLSGQYVWGGVSIGCALTVMIYALGKSSGANFNPAVSLALGLCGKLPWKEVAIYMGVQLVAGICAGFSYLAMFEDSWNLQPQRGHTWWQAGIAEVVYTFMLCFVVLNVAASKMHAGKNQFYGLAIGFVIVAGDYSGGSVSMGGFNPAVAFGIDVSSYKHGIKYCFIYTAFEFVGAALAAVAFKICRAASEAEGATADAEEGISAKLLSEFLGTYILVLTVGLNVLSGSTAGAFSIAASLMCMIFALGTCSGAHFNPAVTTAVLCSGRNKISAKDAAMYMVVQVVAGLCAAFTYSVTMNGETFALKPAAYEWYQVVVAEFVFTLVLAFVVLSVATVKSALSEYFGFAIGMCVTVGGCAVGKVSGGSLNPAVSIGISGSHIIGGGSFWPCLVYTLVEIVAGAVAAGAFMFTQPSEYADKNAKKSDEVASA